jgi:N-acetylglucosaminyldiphosphoundecaprenol N-acetyl-beta-D-mannosaminyltransferase
MSTPGTFAAAPSPAAPRPLPPRIRLGGISIDPVTQRQAIDHILASLADGQGGWVITPNLDQLRLCNDRPDLRPMFDRAQLVLPDGMPLIWASRVQGTRLPERVAGSELIFTLTAAAAAAGRSVYLLGGNPCSADNAAEVLRKLSPGLRVAGTLCPPFGFEKDAEQIRRINEELLATRPDIVFVGLGFPKQERLIETLRPLLPATWFLGIGVSFSFVAGEIRRAPRWVQRMGLEWVHRMCQEPGRLFKRYVLHDLPYAGKLFATLAWRRAVRRPPPQ